MHAHKTTVTVREDHQVVVRLPDDFPAGEAEVIVTPRPTVASSNDSVAAFDVFLASLPAAPVVRFSYRSTTMLVVARIECVENPSPTRTWTTCPLHFA
jgi:hypothetical protein